LICTVSYINFNKVKISADMDRFINQYSS